jgi:hypothetical protein
MTMAISENESQVALPLGKDSSKVHVTTSEVKSENQTQVDLVL